MITYPKIRGMRDGLVDKPKNIWSHWTPEQVQEYNNGYDECIKLDRQNILHYVGSKTNRSPCGNRIHHATTKWSETTCPICLGLRGNCKECSRIANGEKVKDICHICRGLD